ncbi:DUF7344 domain-containing protein [Halobellus clavatus]|jgi:hypothetical protein|uniref:DUF7344 domain-containing protein n=1 Tax=Halobellus clavatus TaxID=660517 RepID=A0A1H3FM78_9EURY|nr:hypothetical protein [Halobellus clavatus]SDX92040.1 hypothetical protein SAMN04487946_10450 [Halobellus clavatus]
MSQRATTELQADVDADADASADDALDKDEVFDLMSNHRRRYAIHYLKGADSPVPLAELAEQVAAWEHDKEVAEITSAERKTTYTSLQQTHLPRLDRAGVVDFEDGEVELEDRVERLDIYLDIVPENSISWGMYYLGLSAFSLVVLAALWTDLLPTDGVPLLAYPTVLVAMFAVSAGYHAYVNRKYRFGNLERPP